METLPDRTTWKTLSLKDTERYLKVAEDQLGKLPKDASAAEKRSAEAKEAELWIRKLLLEENESEKNKEISTEPKKELVVETPAATVENTKAVETATNTVITPEVSKSIPIVKETKTEKVPPGEILAQEIKKAGQEFTPKEIEDEVRTIFAEAKVQGLKISSFTDMKSLKLEAGGPDIFSVAMKIKAGKIAKYTMGLEDISFSGKIENSGNAITLGKNYIFEGGGKLKGEIEKYFEKLGDEVKNHLEKKLGKEIDSINIKEGKLAVTFKENNETAQPKTEISAERIANEQVIQNIVNETAKGTDPSEVMKMVSPEKPVDLKKIGRFQKFKDMVAGYVDGTGEKLSESAERFFWSFAPKFLKVGAIATMINGAPIMIGASSSEANYGHISSIQKELIAKRTDPGIFSMLSKNAQKVYTFNAKGGVYDEGEKAQPYVILDKDSACVYLFDRNNKLIKKMPAVLGRTKGETPNMADINTEAPGPNTTTPMGSYHFKLMDPKNDPFDFRIYERRIFAIYNDKGEELNMAFHEAYPGELAKRTAALNNPSPEARRISWGCINVSQGNFDAYVRPSFGDDSGGRLYVLPDSGSKVDFDPEF